MNGATCVDQIDGYMCLCVPGYSGIQCQTDIDECASTPCHFGGTCLHTLNGYTCLCIPGYSGLQCQTNINECVRIIFLVKKEVSPRTLCVGLFSMHEFG